MKKFSNAKEEPKVYYGLHFADGIAEYDSRKVFINQDTAIKMNKTFSGKPLYVGHVENVDLENIQEADGFVVESFFNKNDGHHWAKFIVISDKGHEAIRKGWKLSNAYIMKEHGAGGQWHGTDYEKEVTQAEYEHLAIVSDPRYAESVIMTPEQFQTYNTNKQEALENRFINTKGDKKMFSLFKKEKIENSIDLAATIVLLPKSKVEKTLNALVEEADASEIKKTEKQMANGDSYVNIGDKEMTVNEMVKMCQELMTKKEEVTAVENKEEPKKDDEPVANADTDEEEEKKQNSNFLKLRSAHEKFVNHKVIETSQDRVARGKSRYGSAE